MKALGAMFLARARRGPKSDTLTGLRLVVAYGLYAMILLYLLVDPLTEEERDAFTDHA